MSIIENNKAFKKCPHSKYCYALRDYGSLEYCEHMGIPYEAEEYEIECEIKDYKNCTHYEFYEDEIEVRVSETGEICMLKVADLIN